MVGQIYKNNKTEQVCVVVDVAVPEWDMDQRLVIYRFLEGIRTNPVWARSKTEFLQKFTRKENLTQDEQLKFATLLVDNASAIIHDIESFERGE